MEGFGPALDGHYDAEVQLSRYLRRRAARGFADERDEKRAVDSREAFEARRGRVRADFVDAVGGLPDRPDDPRVETTGVLERDGYAIELVTFRSRPDFHVTANCYVPDGDGPHPGVLFLCGHVRAAKADPHNQRACIELVRNGFVVVIADPVAQGEREQYRDPGTGEALVAGGGGVFAHCYAGQGCFYAGASLARFVVHDARCALDYLCGRPDVDEGRVGATGTSGGGVQTSYLALVDDRLAAAAPCCSVTERSEWLKTGKRIDAEQVVPGAVPRGINYDDFLAAMAPRPVCIGAAASDEYFPIEGVRETYERLRRVYRLYDAAENADLLVADQPHCSVHELGDGVLAGESSSERRAGGVIEWFCDRLGDGPYEPPDELPVADEADLQCTPRGSVRAAYPDERTVDDLVAEYVTADDPDVTADDSNVAADDSNVAADDLDVAADDPGGGLDVAGREYADRLRRTVVETLDLDREGCDLDPRYVSRSESDGLAVERVFFATERDPDALVAGVLVTDPDVATESPAVVLYENGTGELPGRSTDVAALAAEFGAALVFDPRGVGAVRNRAIPVPEWADDYYGIYGTEFKLAYDALLVGTSLFGTRVFDVRRAVEFLRDETGGERVALVGEGAGAYHALYAAAVLADVGAVRLRGLGPSFREMATSREYPYDPRLTAFDVAGECDLPHLRAALDARGVSVNEG